MLSGHTNGRMNGSLAQVRSVSGIGILGENIAWKQGHYNEIERKARVISIKRFREDGGNEL